MRLEWILLAEGAGTNASGIVTAISINTNVLATPTVPVTTKRVVLTHFVGEAKEAVDLAGKDLSVSVQVMSPSGKPILANTATSKFNMPVWPELPTGLDIAIELQLRVTEYGTHEITVTAQTDNEATMEAHTYLYVMQPPVPAHV
jgi:hypothetical protein